MSEGNSCKPGAIYAPTKPDPSGKGSGERSKSGENGKKGAEYAKAKTDDCSWFVGIEGKKGNKAPKRRW